MEGALKGTLEGGAPGGLGVAVSGGGDSVALLVLLVDWARPRGVALRVATVDHGLRPEAADEATAVAGLCARLGVAHDILHWDGTARRGNLQDAARRARLRLLAGWAATHGLSAVALGHTRDDQAETVLMRLARGAGVDGLSAMAPVRRGEGTVWVRPLLSVGRAALRQELRARGIDWAEDALNDDTRFLRVRARRALAALGPVGIYAAGLAATAARMASARAALEAATAQAAARLATLEGGDVTFDLPGLMALPEEIRARLVNGTLRWIGAGAYAPRRAALARAVGRIAAGHDVTLAGCTLRVRDGGLRIGREWRAVRGRSVPVAGLLDGRWRLMPPEGCRTEGLHAAPLGPEGLQGCPDWRATGLPRATLVAGPAVWAGPTLVAAPLAGLRDGWRAATVPAAADFPTLFMAH
ncbi:tRNA lysidine(34) synthetase TilS [Rhodobaculum claviforme]|uniref:tRNA(Ile)-lysidine synthase n=1 Tax=Rhodobaculum claviforme TaxID=1549854 RepID=A0A934TMZ9_9RHOB|nr:tRNA lysidine(34) synthetase TilS [Rhodobaculum claviforme]